MGKVPGVPVSADRPAALERARLRMGKLFAPNQVLGRRNSIGCVALEITQRCNLDCTLCYLSENSERVKDLPLPEVFRRIDEIRARFGAPTSVQITGGDPTLRAGDELVAIVRMARSCPRLPKEPFRAETLDSDLDRLAREFLNDPRNATVDPAARVVRFSEILKFYTEDFRKAAPSLVAYANRYRDEKIPEDYRVEFIPYDWTLNKQ
jgi:hypothetical protein